MRPYKVFSDGERAERVSEPTKHRTVPARPCMGKTSLSECGTNEFNK